MELTPLYLGFPALLTAVGGFYTSIAASKEQRKKDSSDCDDRLRSARLEAAEMADQVYELRMDRARRTSGEAT